MNLKNLTDGELLQSTQQLVQRERDLLTQVLHHLKEVERRRLYSDLGYSSLFDYAVRELKYSEGQAGRRVQALKLLQELPQVEEKIQQGALNLSNICQAQSFFRAEQKAQATAGAPTPAFSSEAKLQILKELENKSAREGQKILLKKSAVAQPERVDLRLSLDPSTWEQLQEVRSLLGPKAEGRSWEEVLALMAQLCSQSLKEKKFGKKRVLNSAKAGVKVIAAPVSTSTSTPGPGSVLPAAQTLTPTPTPTPTSELAVGGGQRPEGKIGKAQSPKVLVSGTLSRRRAVSQNMQHKIWCRDQGRCCKCGSRSSLHLDHIRPVALGGESTVSNLRLLCRSCNEREAIKIFGLKHMESFRKTSYTETEAKVE